MGTLIVGIIVAGIVFLIIRKLYTDKKKGRSSCGCNCSCCPNSCACHPTAEKE